VIGINTWIRRDAQNIGFSIPIDIAKMVSAELIDHKMVQRPWLGIAMEPIDETFSKSLGLPASTIGVYIAKIVHDSPAAKSELQRGDIIQKIDGQNVTESKEVQEIVRAHKVNDILHFLVLRDKALKAVAVNIGQYPITAKPSAMEDD
jgi:S1-C subfamily serine protease